MLLDVVIPGAQKAGTTSVLDALGTHSGLVRHSTPEFPPLLSDVDLDHAIAESFPPARNDQLRLAKSVGLMHQAGSFERLHAHNPALRLVFMLREPVSRMYSAYWFARRTGDEHLDSFADAIAREGTRTEVPSERRARVDYRQRSDYLTPLRHAAELFGRDQLKICLMEDFAADSSARLVDIQAWLGLPIETQGSGGVARNQAAGVTSTRLARMARSNGPAVRAARRVLPREASRRARRTVIALNETPIDVPPLDRALRRRLMEDFEEHNRSLAEEFDLDLTRWSPT